MLKKSPSGVLCPYYYMGGELHPLSYDGYKNDKDKLFAIIDEEQTFILQSSGLKNRRIWINLCKTKLDGEVIDKLIVHLIAIRSKIYQICLVDCSQWSKIKIKARLKQADYELYTMTHFFSDPELAKQWLVGKNHKLI